MKKHYFCDYINDVQLFKSVAFAIKLIESRGQYQNSITISANYYEFNFDLIKKYVDQHFDTMLIDKNNSKKFKKTFWDNFSVKSKNDEFNKCDDYECDYNDLYYGD